MRSIAGPARPWLAAGLVLAAATVGCGNRNRPVVTPVSPTGPAGTPAGGYALVLTQPLLRAAQSNTNPCPALLPPAAGSNIGVLYTSPAVATVIDFSGDSVLAQATIGYGPLTSAIGPSTNEVFSLNCDGTISGIPLSSTLQQNNVTTTTILAPAGAGVPSAFQSNMVVQNSALYVVNQAPNSSGQYTVGALNAASPPALLQQIVVAPAVVALAASPTSQRVYAISQGADGSNVTWGQCSTPGALATNGQVDSIDTSTNAVSKRIPVGNCPVFGLTTPDGLRTFILNRGSGTITVINSQQDALDTGFTSNSGQPGTISLNPNSAIAAPGQAAAGPVYAAYFPQHSLLVTANYDSGTVSFVNVPIDTFGNDAPGFGTVLATTPVGAFPAALSILGDGSRVYVALQGDPTNAAASGAIAIVNATSFNLQGAPISVPGHPRAIASTYNNPTGKVYVVAPDSELLTILRTDSDTISAQVQLQGCGVDVHTNYQYDGQSNLAGPSVTANTLVNSSDSPGSGAPTSPFVCQ